MNLIAGPSAKSLVRTIAALGLAASAAVGLAVLPATSASAASAPMCDGGDRGTAAYWASSGQFTTPRTYSWTDGTAANKVELRYNAAHRCVWGLYNGGNSATVYLDRSTNGGASWTGWVDPNGPAKSVYTGVWNDISPLVARACANYNGRSYCTGWY